MQTRIEQIEADAQRAVAIVDRDALAALLRLTAYAAQESASSKCDCDTCRTAERDLAFLYFPPR